MLLTAVLVRQLWLQQLQNLSKLPKSVCFAREMTNYALQTSLLTI